MAAEACAFLRAVGQGRGGGGGMEEGGIKMRVEILGERAEDLQSGSG